MLDLPSSIDGKRRQRRVGGFTSQREAAEALRMAGDHVRHGLHLDDVTLTVGAWLEQWLAGRARLRPTTARGYADHIRLYLTPGVGHIKLDRLRATDLDRLYAAMRKLGRPEQTDTDDDMLQRLLSVRVEQRGPARPLASATVARAHAVLRAALNTAVKRRLVAHNVATFVELESRRRPPARVWTSQQVGAFLDRVEGDRLQTLFHLIAYQGLRRGEACGLRWNEVDLDTGLLRVIRQTVQVGKQVYDGEPKTRAGGRAIALDETTVTVLRVHRRRILQEKLAWGPAYQDHGLVFCKEDGTPYKPESVSQRFERLTARVGLPKIRLHELRHTSASIGLSAGETLKEVSERLGHSTITITRHLHACAPGDGASLRRAAVPSDPAGRHAIP